MPDDPGPILHLADAPVDEGAHGEHFAYSMSELACASDGRAIGNRSHDDCVPSVSVNDRKHRTAGGKTKKPEQTLGPVCAVSGTRDAHSRVGCSDNVAQPDPNSNGTPNDVRAPRLHALPAPAGT